MTINNLRRSIDNAIALAISHDWEVSESSPLDGEVSLSLNKYDRRIDITYRISPTGYLTFHVAHLTYNIHGDRYEAWKRIRPEIGSGLHPTLGILMRSRTVLVEPGPHGSTNYIRNPDPLPDTIEITKCEHGEPRWSCPDHPNAYSGQLLNRLAVEASARLHLRHYHSDDAPQ